MSPTPKVTQCIATKSADRSSSAIAKSNSSLHGDVTEALALPNKTQRADSRERARAQRSYTTSGWKSFFATCDIVSSRESPFRQVTPRRLFTTPLLQLRTDRARDEILSCLRHLVQLRLFIHHTFWNSTCFSQECQGLLKPKPMVMLWESTFIGQVCATRSYRHPATRIGLNDWLLPITMRIAYAIS
jgi:hypothetical protein